VGGLGGVGGGRMTVAAGGAGGGVTTGAAEGAGVGGGVGGGDGNRALAHVREMLWGTEDEPL
jgi:hypothetical protein